MNDPLNILIIGNGGREHALAWKTAQSPLTRHVFVAPGNAGTALEPHVSNVDISPTDLPALIEFAKKESIDLTLVGPEAPLAAGIVDQFMAASLVCFGPTQAATQLEASKSFCKNFLQKHHIPTARYATFTDQQAAISYIEQHPLPVVIKADGLAAGKGVIIAQTLGEAKNAVSQLLNHNKIVIEEFLSGEELSYIVITDGTTILPLASSQDHKRRDDADLGPNTGGMGAYSPAPLLTPELEQKILTTIIGPTVKGMAKDHTPYSGFLYAGLMISQSGEPSVLEYNCRLGDPETQPILMRLKSDLVGLCLAALNHTLGQQTLKWDPRLALTVVMAAGGYPGSYAKGDVISGLTQTTQTNQKIFHAGTALKHNNVITNGGRVLGVSALGSTITEAQQRAYQLTAQIHWPNCFFRTDIGHNAL